MLTVLALAEAEVGEVWAKAITHSRQDPGWVGAAHVVYPESLIGERVAHMLSGGMIDYIEFDDGTSIVRTMAPPFSTAPSPSRPGAPSTASPSSREAPGRTSLTPGRRPRLIGMTI